MENIRAILTLSKYLQVIKIQWKKASNSSYFCCRTRARIQLWNALLQNALFGRIQRCSLRGCNVSKARSFTFIHNSLFDGHAFFFCLAKEFYWKLFKLTKKTDFPLSSVIKKNEKKKFFFRY